jgi:hypothetical protein
MFLRLKATRIIGHHFLEVVNNNIPYGIFMNISMYKGYLPSSPITLFNNDNNSWFGCIDALLQYLNVNTNYLLKSKLNIKKY